MGIDSTQNLLSIGLVLCENAYARKIKAGWKDWLHLRCKQRYVWTIYDIRL